MIQSLILTLREGLEAALVVSILLAYLARIDYRRGFRAVWWGAAGAVLLSLGAGAVLFTLGLALEGKAEEIFEGSAMLLAVVILSWMVVWMKSQGRSMRGRLEAEAHRAATMGAASLAALAFVAVGREGLETALFLFAANETSSASSTIIGGLLGLAVAVALGVALYRGSHRLNLRAFFTYTGLLLILIAGGLLAHGIHEFQEAGWLPVFVEHLWDTNSVLDENSDLGRLLKGLFGYNGNPSLTEVVAYIGYLATTLTYFLRTPRAEPAEARTAGSGQTSSGRTG